MLALLPTAGAQRGEEGREPRDRFCFARHCGPRSAQDSLETSRSEATVETTVTTTFETGGMASVAVPKNTPSPIQCILEGTTTHVVQDIKAYLGKWVQIGQGTIDGTSTGQLGSWNFPEVLLAMPIYANKLEGFQGVRGTILVKVLINGTPYQQGKLLLSFIPQAQVNGTVPAIRLAHFMTITQLPHAEIDISCDSECIFEIPYISPALFYNMLTGEGPWGTMYMHVYAPLATGSGSTDCNYAVWACLDPRTVELYNPTKAALAVVPQLKPNRFKGQMKTRSKRVRGRSAPGTVEAEAMSSGTVSSALLSTSKVAGSLSMIPSLSALAGPVAWATGVAGKLASAFGFSKPLDADKVCRMERSYMFGASNCDQPDRSQSLAITSYPAVELMPDLSLTDEDEMAYDYLVTRKAYWTRWDWSSSASPMVLLKTIIMNPREFIATSGSGIAATQFRTPMAHLACNHSLWRGDIVLTFKLVKTDSHTGRLLIVFFPGLTTAPVDATDTEFCHRAVIDLTTGNEFTYTIPMADESPYLYTTGAYGCVCVYVLTGLRSPDLVAPFVTMICEVSGAPGFEFAHSQFDGWCPAYFTLSSPLTKAIAPAPYTPNMKGKSPMIGQSFEDSPRLVHPLQIIALEEGVVITDEDTPAPALRFEGQMLTSNKVPTATDKNTCAVQTTTLGGATSGSKNLCAARLCIGERLTSVRQLVIRFTGCTLPGAAPYRLRPYSVGLVLFNGSTAVLAPALTGDWWGHFANCYAYNRGTVRFKLMPTGGVVRARQVADGNTTAAITNSATFSWDLISTNWTYDHFSNGSGHLSVQTNPASAYFTRLTRPIRTSVNEPVDAYTRPHPVVDLDVSNNLFANSILRAGGEDCQFSYFLGIPPLQLLPFT